AAQSRKKGFWRKTVGRTCTTGRPDQFNTCSPSQCCRCWGESVIFVRLICDTVICEMLTNASRSSRSRATAAAVTVASRDCADTPMPKYRRWQPAKARATTMRPTPPTRPAAPVTRIGLEIDINIAPMNELLAKILDAQGGMDRWQGYEKVEATIVK